MDWKSYVMGLLTVFGLVAIAAFVMASPGSISNNGDGTWSYSRAASQETWTNYVTYYTENWPGKYYDWLESTGGCVVDYSINSSRESQLDACKTANTGKKYLEDHLDEILNGEYQSEKQVWTERQQAAVSGTLD